jgi:hypothetical protein
MCPRWTAAGMLDAESRFRKVQGFRALTNLAVAIDHDLLRRRQQVSGPPFVGNTVRTRGLRQRSAPDAWSDAVSGRGLLSAPVSRLVGSDAGARHVSGADRRGPAFVGA